MRFESIIEFWVKCFLAMPLFLIIRLWLDILKVCMLDCSIAGKLTGQFAAS